MTLTDTFRDPDSVTPLPRFLFRPAVRRCVLVLASWTVYILFFARAHAVMGEGVAAFSLLLALMVSWLFGLRAGVVAGLITLPVNLWLLNEVRMPSPLVAQVIHALPGSVVNICVAALLGYLHELRQTLQRQQRQLSYQASHDTLTHLPNRALFEDRLRQALTQDTLQVAHFAVLFLDLDGFKHVNDSLGHGVGDELLVAVAGHLQGALRYGDTIARVGGDEFTVIARHLRTPQDAGLVAQKLLAALTLPVEVQGHSLNINVSIGISVFPQDGTDVITLQKHADMAMYKAKRAGKNGARFFVPEMNAQANERFQLEFRLRAALHAQALTLHYQPQFDEAGRVVGFEALTRWTDPELGIVPPDRFIPVAEDSGLMVPLGRWVIHQACRQLAAWHAAGHCSLRMAFNVSPEQFTHDDFVSEVGAALQHFGLKGADLELELTERLVVRDFESTVQRMRALRALGVGIAIDDFGSGHSALRYLLRLPVSTLKVDRVFVQDLDTGDETESQNARRVVGAVVALAHALGLDVVAEGVETPAQLHTVHDLGCQRIQGFLLGRPLPPSEADAVLAAQKGRH